MSFPLQYLESYLSEESLLLGEQLLEEGHVRNLTEVERRFWVAEVQDERVYEVEIKISPSKVTAVSCECKNFLQEKQCGHMAAMLLHLRKELTKEEAPTNAATVEEDTPRRLTTGLVLEEVGHEELIAFVKQYAKTNRNFALALKARFVPNVSGIDSREKYLQLLDSTINAARRPDRTFNQRGISNIYKILLEIENQIEDAIAQGYLSEAVVMAQSIIEKITPLLRKMQTMQDEMRQQIKAAFESFRKVLAQSPPQALKQTIWDYCSKECKKLVYRNNQIDQYFYRTLSLLVEEPDQTNQLLELLDEQITRYYFEKREMAQVLLLKLALLEKLGRVEEVRDFINQYITNEEVLFFAIRQSMHNGNLQRAKALATSGLERADSESVIASLEMLLLEIAHQENDAAAIAFYAKQRFLKSLDFKYYIQWKAVQTEHWHEQLSQLLDAIRGLPFSTEKLHLIASIYYEEGWYQELLTYLQETKSLDLARAFGHLLLPFDRDGVYRLYKNLFEQYLSNHIGRKPSEKIRAMIRQLYELNAEDLAENLIENLRSNFPERHTLMEELELF